MGYRINYEVGNDRILSNQNRDSISKDLFMENISLTDHVPRTYDEKDDPSVRNGPVPQHVAGLDEEEDRSLKRLDTRVDLSGPSY